MTHDDILYLAAYLADPIAAPDRLVQRVGQIDFAPMADLSDLLKTLDRNKVALIAIKPEQGSIQAAICAHPAFAAAQQAEQQRHDDLRREYLLAQGWWRTAGIDDCVIKSSGAFPAFPYKTSNLDLLVADAHGDRARQVLRSHGYVELRNVEEHRKYLFRLFRSGVEVSGLHVHEHVGWYESFLDEKAVLARQQRSEDDPALLIPSNEDILLTTLSHFFYEDKDVKLDDLLKYHHCLRRGPVDWNYVYRIADEQGWLDGLYAVLLLCDHLDRIWYDRSYLPAAVRAHVERQITPRDRQRLDRYLASEPLDWPHNIPFVFSKRYFYRRLWHNRRKKIGGRLADLVIHTLQGIKLHLHSQPHMLIALSGTDGSGKTVQAELLDKAFHGCHLRTRYVWSRGGSSRWVSGFAKLAKRLLPARKASGETAPAADQAAIIARRQRLMGRPLIRSAWMWLTTLELAARYTWRVRLPLWRNRVVICDRYVLDTWAEWAAYAGDGFNVRHSLAARFLRWVAPKPDLAYWLSLPSETAAARSSSAPPLSLIAAQAQQYAELAPNLEAQMLDATQPLEQIADDLAHDALTHYFDHYWTLVNALFHRNPRPMPAIYQDTKMGEG